MSPQAVKYVVAHGEQTYDALRGTYKYSHWLGDVVLNRAGKVVTTIAKSRFSRYIR